MKILLLPILITTALPLALIGRTDAETSTFSNTSAILIQDGAQPTSASPYPSAINVAGMTGIISKMTVKLNGLTHTFPADVDIMLVGPDGTSSIIMSDAGGGLDLNAVTITLDDSAAAPLPETIITSGTYRPTNYGTNPDSFLSPAPSGTSNSTLSVFNGKNPTGVWSLYVMDDSQGDPGVLAGWSMEITTAQPVQAGQLVISEYRLRGTNGALDEFVEIHNATDASHTVQAADGSSGYALAASTGGARFIIPNGTVIPARGHFLGTNSTSYSLASYAPGNATYTTDIPDNTGIALFRTATAANFTLANRLDAVGPTTEANALYREGSGYAPTASFSTDFSFFRDFREGGLVKDTNNNAADFLYGDTNGTLSNSYQRLGAPGPENLASPIRLSTGWPLARRVVDAGVAIAAAPNRVRDLTSTPATNSTFGTLALSRQFTNTTGVSLTRLRFRIIDLTTFYSPTGVADLRARTSSDTSVALSAGGTAQVRGTVLEQLPTQPNGGGLNASLSVGAITVGAPLADGASVNVRFLFGIQQKGTFRIALMPETLPAACSGVWVISGNTEDPAVEVETVPEAAITSISRATPDVKLFYRCAPGLLYQLQYSSTLATWTDVGAPIAGRGIAQSTTLAGGAAPARMFYRLKQLP